MEQLIVAAVRGVVQQEEAEVKYQSGFSQLFPPVPQTRDDLVIYGVALEEPIKIHLHTNCLCQTLASSHVVAVGLNLKSNQGGFGLNRYSTC